jgi:hypothetical protein
LRRLFLLIILALIVHLSLYPWRFRVPEGDTDAALVLLGSWPNRLDLYAVRDALANILLYFPLGAIVFLLARQHRPQWVAAAAAVCAGSLLSISLEMIQVYVPGRITSLFDVLCNCLGIAAGVLTAARFPVAWENMLQRSYSRFWSPPRLLLCLWAAYYLYPLWPSLAHKRLYAEVMFLLYPNSFLPAEIFRYAAEWFTVATAIQAALGRMRYRWIIGAVCFHLVVVRPLFLTRLLERDEVAGIALVLLLWRVVPERFRLRFAIAMMAMAIVAPELAPLHFSTLPSDFSPGAAILRRTFDFGAMIWLLVSGRREMTWIGDRASGASTL